MALSEKTTLTHPIEVNLTAGSSSGVAILIGSGSPAGATDPWSSAGKGSLHIRIDATDDYSPLYCKVDADSADDDWVPVIVDLDEDDKTLEGHLTLNADKRLYLRGTDNSIYSNAASIVTMSSASWFDINAAKVGTGTKFNSILAGSGTAIFGALAASTASNTCLTVAGLTQEHKCFISPSGAWSGCLMPRDISCSPGGGVLYIGAINIAAETTAVTNNPFSFWAVAACGA